MAESRMAESRMADHVVQRLAGAPGALEEEGGDIRLVRGRVQDMRALDMRALDVRALDVRALHTCAGQAHTAHRHALRHLMTRRSFATWRGLAVHPRSARLRWVLLTLAASHEQLHTASPAHLSSSSCSSHPASRRAAYRAVLHAFATWNTASDRAGARAHHRTGGRTQRMRRLRLLLPQVSRIATRRGLRSALARWQVQALGGMRCTYAASARTLYTLRQSLHAWRRARANSNLARARTAAATHVLRRLLSARTLDSVRQWQGEAARLRRLSDARAVPWPGAHSCVCEGLRTRWLAWRSRVSVLSARVALQTCVKSLCLAKAMGRAVQRWGRHRHKMRAALSLLCLRDSLSMGSVLRRWRRRSLYHRSVGHLRDYCRHHSHVASMRRVLLSWEQAGLKALDSAHVHRCASLALATWRWQRRATRRVERSLERARVHHGATLSLGLCRWYRRATELAWLRNPRGRAQARGAAAAEALLTSGLGSRKGQCAAALMRWRAESRKTAALVVTSRMCRRRLGERRCAVLWWRWLESTHWGAAAALWLGQTNAGLPTEVTLRKLRSRWQAWRERVRRASDAAALADYSRPLLLSSVLERWVNGVRYAGTGRAALALALPLLLDRSWRSWLAYVNATYAATAIMAAALPLLSACRRRHAEKAGLRRWRRWANLHTLSDGLHNDPLQTLRRWRAWRTWRRMRSVRAAVRQRRASHQARWALCRAWGRWRLRAVLGELGKEEEDERAMRRGVAPVVPAVSPFGVRVRAIDSWAPAPSAHVEWVGSLS